MARIAVVNSAAVSRVVEEGLEHHRAGRLPEAEAAYRRVLAAQSEHPDALHLLGVIAHQVGKNDVAVKLIRKSIALQPDVAEFHNNLGNALKGRGQLDEAVAAYRRALDLKPDFPEAHNNLGAALQGQGKYEEAITAYQSAIAVNPLAGLKIRLATLLPVISPSREALLAARERLQAEVEALGKADIVLSDPYKEVGAANFYLAYHGLNDRDVQRAIARLHLKACPSLAWAAPASQRRGRGRLRIGFISHFFGDHAVSWCFGGLIEQLDRQRFKVVVLTIGTRVDAVTEAVRRAVDRSIVVPEDLARARTAIAAEELDVLVYTDIGMEPLTYFLGFARLAPVQCVLTGHPVTTGIPNLDYFVSSDSSEPPGAEAHYSETLVRLKGKLAYYYRSSPPARPRSREDFGFYAGQHLYACPQSLCKFHPDFDAVLAGILRRDGAARLVLVENKIWPWNRLLAERFERTMPDVIDRVRWLPHLSFGDFLSLLIESDVLLDPLHFGGGNTSRQSFAFNKPVVTLPGEFLRGRITYGHYRLMGLSECIARNTDDYVDIAVRLGTDPAWRHEVEARIKAVSPVLYENVEGVRELEQFFLEAVAEAGEAE